MIKVAIADDEHEVLEYLKDSISKVFEELGAEASIYTFDNGEELISKYSDEGMDIVFLDLEMPGKDGFETARYIRNKGKNTVIVFVTNREDLVFDAFQYEASAFIRKSRLDGELPDAVCKAYKKVSSWLSVYLFKAENRDLRLHADDILYFSSQGHNVRVYLDNGESVRIFYTMEQLENMMSEEAFVRCHSGVIVNCAYIYSVERENIVLTNGGNVYLSRHRRKSVKDALQRYLRNL